MINTFFWFFFFMVGFVTSLRIIEDLGPAFTERWLRRRMSAGVLMVVYVLLVLLLLKALRLYGTTESETANAIRVGIFIYMALRMQNPRTFRWLLLGIFVLIWPYFVMKWSVVAVNAVMLALLLPINRYHAWITASWQRHLPVVIGITAVYWRWTAWLYNYSVTEALVLIIVAVTVLLLAALCDQVLNYWQEQLRALRYDNQHDALTGVRSLSKFNADFGRYRKLAVKGTTAPVFLVMVDVDHFKRINDTYGHLVGNTVLREFSQDLQAYLEQSAFPAELYRTGGEEFSILVTGGATHDDVVDLMSGYLAHLRLLAIHTEDVDIHLTLSVGITQVGVQDQDNDTPIARADAHLYAAKHAGRDTLVGDDKVN